jgi:hypothetical protein
MRPLFILFATLLLSLVCDLERRAVLGPLLTPIVASSGSNVGMAQPLLHLSDVGVVLKRVGRGRRAQCVWAAAVDVDADDCQYL